jgi:RimJ/RimL family protein N-acetyltransferase
VDLTTSRLVLHAIAPQEAARIVARAPDATDRWHPEYPFADELHPLRALAAAVDVHPVFTLYQVRERASGLAVGGIGFFGPPEDDGVVELGYGLVPAARGAGFATEALLAATTAAFAGGARMIRADALLENLPSQRVLQKAGFVAVRQERGLAFFELPAPARSAGR